MMLPAPAIKICGISDCETAQACCQGGADFIGLVFHSKSVRYISDLTLAAEIADIAKQASTIPVGVFTEHDQNAIETICQQSGITTVQLHGQGSKACHQALPANFSKIYAVSNNDELPPLEELDRQKDYLIFDNTIPGSGITTSYDRLDCAKDFRYFIAGGLDKANVIKFIQQTKPFGVDASSQLEYVPGKKSIDRINAFIKRVKDYDYCR